VDGDGMVVVDIRADVTDALLQAIAGAGGRVALALPTYGTVRARVPIRRLEAIAALPEVRYVTPQQGFLTNPTVTEGDAAHAAAAARTTTASTGPG
jgi:hypothetical protein